MRRAFGRTEIWIVGTPIDNPEERMVLLPDDIGRLAETQCRELHQQMREITAIMCECAALAADAA